MTIQNTKRMRKKILFFILVVCILSATYHIFLAQQGLRNTILIQNHLKQLIQKQKHIEKKIQNKKVMIKLMEQEDKDIIEERIIKVLKYTTPKHVTLLVNNMPSE